MSNLGPVNLHTDNSPYSEGTTVSQDMQSAIDKEIKRILHEAYKRAVLALKENQKKLDEVAERLLTKETLEGEEFEKIMKGTKTVEKKTPLLKKTV
jgi:cell division protease FtsH